MNAQNDNDHHQGNDIDDRVDLVFNQPASTSRRRRWTIAATIVGLVTVVGLIASSVAGGSQGQGFRTARAEVRSVDAELSSVATIEPVSQAAVAFPASGTVATVDVAAGDDVSLGQALGSLDTAQLTRALNQKKESLAQAELALSRALDGESSEDAPTVQPASATSTSSDVVLASISQAPTTTSSDPQLAALQQAVLDAQVAVDDAIAASDAAMAAARTVCATDDGDGDPADEVPAGDTSACLAALDEVQIAQAATAAAQQQLAAASDALDEHLGTIAAEAGDSGTGGSAPDQTPSGGQAVGGSAAGGQDDTASSPSAAELVAYQKAVSAAELQVLVAEQAVAQATIVAPIGGTVVAVGFEPGEDVTAASATQTVIIQGDSGVEAVTTVALSDIASIEVGQPATVLSDGSSDGLEGQVVNIAATPDDDATTTSYRVTVGLTEPDPGLGAGTTGTVTILTGSARAALAVPSSAVTWSRGIATVRVVEDGEADDVGVEVGVVGGEWIEVLSGIDAGTDVAIADLDEPLPGASTDVADGQSTTGGIPGGGDLPAGGFTPPGG